MPRPRSDVCMKVKKTTSLGESKRQYVFYIILKEHAIFILNLIVIS